MAKKRRIFSDEELANIADLCEVLESIRARLIREGMSPEDLDKMLQEKRKEQENTQA